MTTYIDIETMVYPLHVGDAPPSGIPKSWEEVPPSNPPVINAGQIAYEGLPNKTNVGWERQWLIRERTEDELYITRFNSPHEAAEYLLQQEMLQKKIKLDDVAGGLPNVID